MAVNRPLYITDASVVWKWLLSEKEEQDLDKAVQLQKDYIDDKVSLVIPHYAWAEILNTLGRKRTFDEAVAYFSYLLGFGLGEYYLTLEAGAIALELMHEFPGISFYDAGYHALALEQGGIFITADEQYYKKTKKKGHVMLLKQYGRKR